jgi:hypothetical protein
MNDLKMLGHEIFPVNTLPQPIAARINSLLCRLRRKLFGPWDASNANEKMLQLTREVKFDIAWVDKGLTIKKNTLEGLRRLCPNIFIVSYSPDDMMNPSNQSRDYLSCLPVYNLHVTTKSYNVKELKNLGANNLLMVDNSFSPSVHRPIAISSDDRRRLGGAVGFIGSWEGDRERSLNFLANRGIPVRIWGAWKKKRKYHENLLVEGRSVWGEEYACCISSFDINLCFLRKVNRDLQTSRSIEIPACGGFMLAERTDEHLRLFEEGKEAEFFSSNEELLDKILYYFAHENKRKSIASKGRMRCLNSGYSNLERLSHILEHVNSLMT